MDTPPSQRCLREDSPHSALPRSPGTPVISQNMLADSRALCLLEAQMSPESGRVARHPCQGLHYILAQDFPWHSREMCGSAKNTGKEHPLVKPSPREGRALPCVPLCTDPLQDRRGWGPGGEVSMAEGRVPGPASSQGSPPTATGSKVQSEAAGVPMPPCHGGPSNKDSERRPGPWPLT